MGPIAILGAGAVGCYYGAMLALAGEDVMLIGRPKFVAAVQSSGLQLIKGGDAHHARVQATTDPAGAKGASLVLVCVKSPDTDQAAQDLAPHLAPTVPVLSLQNGMGNVQRLSAVLPNPVRPAVVYVAARILQPGTVEHMGRGELVLPDDALSTQIAARLSAAGIPCEASPDAEVALWSKLTVNCALNAVSALSQKPYLALLETAGMPETLSTLVAECRAVAKASGVTLPDAMLEQVMGIMRTMPNQLSSTAQDLMAGKSTEIEFLNGEVARRGAALGIPTPLNAAMAALVRAAQS